MKISLKHREVTFGTLDFGETFSSDGMIYIKTEPMLSVDLSAYGCNLDTGELRYFCGEDYVYPINMEVIER